MGITEKAAYIKGLFDGYEIDASKKEGKIISELLELVADMADKIDALENDNAELHEYVEELDHDLGELEEEVYFTESEADEFEEIDDYDDLNLDDEDEYNDDTTYYEVVCPSCGEKVCFDDSLELEDIVCPACGEKINDAEVTEE